MEPEDFDDDNEYDDDADLNCGLTMMDDESELCMNAGTEYCDFKCPYRDEALQFRVRQRKPKPAPLLDLMERKP